MERRRSSPVLVGRNGELTAVTDDLGAALAGRAAVIVIGGDAGIGKTRLAREAAAVAASRGFAVAWGACYPLTDGLLPYGPFSEALRDLAHGPDAAALAGILERDSALLEDILPGMSPARPRAPFQRARARGSAKRLALEGIRRVVEHLATVKPLLLVIEDVQWADAASLDALACLARSLHDARVVVVMTFRSDRPGERSELAAWLAEVERGALVGRLELEPLDRGQTAELVARLLGTEPAASLVDLVQRRSDGNPFFIEELLECVPPDGEEPMPASLRDVVVERLMAAPAGTPVVLAPLAVALRALDETVLAHVAGAPGHDLDAALRAALDDGLVLDAHHAGRVSYRLRHALLGEVVLERLPSHERQRLDAALAAALEDQLVAPSPLAPETPSWAEVAVHWEAAGERGRAVPAWFHAAEEAERRFDLGAAVEAFERVLAGWDVVPEPVAAIGHELLEILDRAAWDAYLAGDAATDVRLRRQAVAEAERSGQPAVSAVACADLAFSLWAADDPVEAEHACLAAEEWLPSVPDMTPARAHVLAVLAQLYMASGQHRRSLPLCEEAIRVAGQLGQRLVEANARNTLGMNLAYLARCAEAAASLEAARTLALELGDAEETGRAYINETEALATCAQDRRALALVDEGVDACDRMGISATYGRALLLHGVTAAYAIGEWALAAAYASRARERRHAPDPDIYEDVHHVELLVATGDWPGAEQRLQRLADALRAYPVELQYTGPFATAEAELRLWRGEPEAALRAVNGGVERLLRADAAMYLVRLRRLGMRAAADLAQVAGWRHDSRGRDAAAGLGQRLRDRTALALSAVGTMTGGARRLVEAELRTADAEGGRLEGRADAAAWRSVADAWGDLDRPYLRAYARWREAEDCLRAGDRGAARAAHGEASAIAMRLGAAPLAAELAALARRSRLKVAAGASSPVANRPAPTAAADADPLVAAFGLTGRELEVLALVMDGASDRQIGDALFISPHTVGTHVSRILGKLGVTSRTEAASVAYRLGRHES